MLRIHCLGPGSVGSLVCFHLRSQSYPISFILRTSQSQHRQAPSSLSLQLDRDSLTRSVSGIDYEFIHAQHQQPIESLLVTTKAHQVSRSLQPLLHRLSRFSTVILLHNGLGVIEEVLERCFPHSDSRPSFILANTSHGVHKIDSGDSQPSHGRFCHSGIGDLKLGVLPNQTVLDGLAELGNQGHWYPCSDELENTSEGAWTPQPLALSADSNPLIKPSLNIPPNLDQHLPHLQPQTHTLHHTLAALLRPEIVEALGTKWLTLPEFQTSALVKLTVNAAINPITALLETRNEALAGEGAFQQLANGVCREASAAFALQASQPNGFSLDHPLTESNLLRQVRQVQRATGANISSMCADVRKLASNRTPYRSKRSRLRKKNIRESKEWSGKPTEEEEEMKEEEEQTEVEYINGYISRLGTKYGLLTPVNDCLSQLIKLKTSVIVTDQRLPPLKRAHQALGNDVVQEQEEEEGERSRNL
ncbi:hypothetical protein CROQUDRAFT_656659 [Cronartium quercuum f. sp. fusiforme G11]|uniref:2-dehydropantoate 2-reductase n=1 Tax=Cronartium quercuum f. sp. fusiforme G11 TaxID=708437 RepID=A0A9P6TCQ1_9BASI|nr:hypothetical protein CROQUDRAFT_656659 [Cronartium quercuum f. sp. fusiforme G11]